MVIGGAALYYILTRKSAPAAVTPAYGSTFTQPTVGARTAAAGAAIASGNASSSNALLKALSNLGSALSSLGKQSSKGSGGGGGGGGQKNVTAPKAATPNPATPDLSANPYDSQNAQGLPLDPATDQPYGYAEAPWDNSGGSPFSGYDALGSPIGDTIGPTGGNDYSSAGDISGLGNAYDSSSGGDYSGGFDSTGSFDGGGGGGEPTDYSIA